MKLRGRVCDFCGKRMGLRDWQYWIRGCGIRSGYPNGGMNSMDVCGDCFAKLNKLLRRGPLVVKEDVPGLADKIQGILIEEAHRDTKRFKLGDTIMYTPNEVAAIIGKHEDELTGCTVRRYG